MPVLVKLGVNANQLYWSRMVAKSAPDLMPLLYASGDGLGDLEMGWIVMERIPFGPLGPGWNGDEFVMLLDAAVRFQREAGNIEARHVATLDVDMLRSWLEVGIGLDPPGPVDGVLERFEADFAWVAPVCGYEVCHGDVHMCNALSRTPPPLSSAAVLIDCQPIIQLWAFDAAYPQVLNSIDTSRVGYFDFAFHLVVLHPGRETALRRDQARAASERYDATAFDLEEDLVRELSGLGLWIESRAMTAEETVETIWQRSDEARLR
jgi:hypothetical protein